MKILEIDGQTWQIEDEGVRFFLLAGKERALLIDSGMTVHNARDIAKGLVSVPVLLLTTHADPDHIGSAAQFEEFYMHPSEATNYYKAQGRSGKFLPVWDGDVIDLGDRELEIIHLPGHTPGSVTVLDRAGRALYGGDPVQDGAIFMFGPQREFHAYIVSMEKLERMGDRFDRIYPSHATCPVTPDIIPKLRRGAERILAGELTGGEAEFHGQRIRRIDAGVAAFLCDAESAADK